MMGFEPATYGLQNRCSTVELHRRDCLCRLPGRRSLRLVCRWAHGCGTPTAAWPRDAAEGDAASGARFYQAHPGRQTTRCRARRRTPQRGRCASAAPTCPLRGRPGGVRAPRIGPRPLVTTGRPPRGSSTALSVATWGVLTRWATTVDDDSGRRAPCSAWNSLLSNWLWRFRWNATGLPPAARARVGRRRSSSS